MRISAWFGFAGIMFLVALLGFYAMPNLHVSNDLGIYNVSESTASFSYWSTIGLVIVGIAFLVLGSHEMLTGSENVTA